MIEKSNVSHQPRYSLKSFLIGAVIFSLGYFTMKWFENRAQRNDFVERAFHSRISELKQLKNGIYALRVQDAGAEHRYKLQIGVEVERDHMLVGDSIAKAAHRTDFEVFRIDSLGHASLISQVNIGK